MTRDRAASSGGEALLALELSPRFVRRIVTIAPGEARTYEDREWRGAIVVVESGAIELECSLGGRRRFEQGAVLWLVDLDLRFVHGVSLEPAVLVAISRREEG